MLWQFIRQERLADNIINDEMMKALFTLKEKL
jgi:hypothetical protein